MLDVETLVEKARTAKRLSEEIDLLEGIDAQEVGYVSLRRQINENELLDVQMLRDVLEAGLNEVVKLKRNELGELLRSVSEPVS